MASAHYGPSLGGMSLPPGWECKLDPTTRKYFYIDHINKKTQWVPPNIPGYGTTHPVPVVPAPSRVPADAEKTRSESSYSSSASSTLKYPSLKSNKTSDVPTGVDMQLKRRLQLMLNANSAAEQQLITDVLVGCNNDETTAFQVLTSELGSKSKAVLSKPKMAAQKSQPKSETEIKQVISRLEVIYGGSFPKDTLTQVAATHNYEMSSIQAELLKRKHDNKSKTETRKLASPTVDHVREDTPTNAHHGQKAVQVNKKNTGDVGNDVGTGHQRAEQQRRREQNSHQKATGVFPNKKGGSSQSQSTTPIGTKGHTEPRARANSDYNVSRTRARGPDASLRMGSRLGARGSSLSCGKLNSATATPSLRCAVGVGPTGLAKGPTVPVMGHNPSLLCK